MTSQSNHGQQDSGNATSSTPAEDFKKLSAKETRFAPLPNILAAAQV